MSCCENTWSSHLKLSKKTDCPVWCTHIYSNRLADLQVDATKLSVGQILLGRIKWIQSQEISVKQLSASSRQKNMYMHSKGLPTDYEIAFWSWETQRCWGLPRPQGAPTIRYSNCAARPRHTLKSTTLRVILFVFYLTHCFCIYLVWYVYDGLWCNKTSHLVGNIFQTFN
jgi:hypothetical protein